jgi:hypothetical protein
MKRKISKGMWKRMWGFWKDTWQIDFVKVSSFHVSDLGKGMMYLWKKIKDNDKGGGGFEKVCDFFFNNNSC